MGAIHITTHRTQGDGTHNLVATAPAETSVEDVMDYIRQEFNLDAEDDVWASVLDDSQPSQWKYQISFYI